MNNLSTSNAITDANRRTYERLYADHSVDASYEVRNKSRVVRKLVTRLPEAPRTILDIGFGMGDTLLRFASEQCLLAGIEPIVTPIRAFHQRWPEIRLLGVVADAQALPFRDQAFDLIILSHVLEHLPDDLEALRELRRVLRPGGHGLVLVPCRDLDENPLHARLYSPRSLRAACEGAGLVVIRQVASGSRPLEAVLRLMLKLAGGYSETQGSPGARRFPRLRRWYQRVVVPLLLAYSRVDDWLASLQGEPLEVGLTLRRDSPVCFPSNADLRSAVTI